MVEVEKPSEAPVAPVRRRQFSLRAMFRFMAGFALLLGFFLYLYPYSVIALLWLFVYPVLELLRLFPLLRWWSDPWGSVKVTLGFYIIMTLLAPGFFHPREHGRRIQCPSNLFQISIALLQYDNRYGSFPPAYIPDDKGRPMHSWRVLILPWMEEEGLYRQYRFDEPWNGPNNSKLAARMPRVYRCPSDQPGSVLTSYVAVTGPGTMWDGAKPTRFKDIKDGALQTIAIVERANSGIHWMEPRDLDIQTMQMAVNPPAGIGISSEHREDSWRARRLGAHVAFAAGSIDWLPNDTPSETLRAMLTIAGGETIDLGELHNR